MQREMYFSRKNTRKKSRGKFRGKVIFGENISGGKKRRENATSDTLDGISPPGGRNFPGAGPF